MDEKVACQPKHEVGLPDPAFSRQPEYIVVIKIRYDRTLSVEPAVIIPIVFKEGKDGILALRRDETNRSQVWLLFTCNNFVITLSRVQVCTLLLSIRRIVTHDLHDVIN